MSMNCDCLEFENDVFFALYAVSKEITRRFNAELEGLNLTYTQYITMSILWEHGSQSMKVLCKKLYLDSGTLTPVLKALENKGYVTRSRSFEDERVLIVSLTEEGTALKDRASAIPLPVEFTDEESSQLKELLKKALNDLYLF